MVLVPDVDVQQRSFFKPEFKLFNIVNLKR